jgi:hypothetical protein
MKKVNIKNQCVEDSDAQLSKILIESIVDTR